MKSHTGAYMTLGKGMIYLYSNKQKVNTRSLTEAEYVAMMLRVQRLFECRGSQNHKNLR